MQADPVAILRNELARRCEKNPNYSLRSFAKALEISPAGLSMILSQKRPISRRAYRKISEALGTKFLGPQVPSVGFCVVPQNDPETVSLETFEKISSWLAYAILSLIKTRGFKPDCKWIARRLGTSVHQVNSAVAALQESGQLKCEAGSWRQSPAKIRINNSISTSFTKNFQRQLIEKSLESLENDPSSLRDHSSITFALNPKDIASAKKEIRAFRLRMATLFEKPKNASEVYNLTVQLAPVTKIIEEKV